MTLGLRTDLRRWVRGLPQWSPVALRQPQNAVEVRLSTAREEFDVTCGAVVAALRPLTLAVGLNAQLLSALTDHPRPQLHFVDRESRRAVGELQLQSVRNWNAPGVTLGLFEIRNGTQRCVPWPYRPWNQWLQNRAMRRNADPHNFFMPPEAVQQQMIFYICPRPVVLVSVDDGSHSNLFPMDLIGPISSDHFTLALRSTSPSISTMKSARRVALSDVPAREYSAAYELGKHHKKAMVEWDHLPFETRRSGKFSLPYPAIALRVREVEILDFATVGSHTFFVSRISSEVSAGDDAQFFHTSGIYQHFRSRIGRPFAPAS